MKKVVIATLMLVLVAGAGCKTTYTRTAGAADRLERSADAFANAAYESNSACSINACVHAAREFASQACEFRQALDSGSDHEVVFSFKRLWHSYRALLHEVDSLRDRQIKTDLKPITEAFINVQRHVKTGYSHADPDLYASGGYLLDPYYN